MLVSGGESLFRLSLRPDSSDRLNSVPYSSITRQTWAEVQ
jgi:hypothetical protein